MKIIQAYNAEDAFYKGIKLFYEEGVSVVSRGLRTLEVPRPVCTVYENPVQRIIMNPVRDINPFLFFFESLWVLAGRQDVGFLELFNKRMREFSDNGHTFHAAYGHRLRHHFNNDQIKEVINLLRKKPDTRQAVLQIWDCEKDLNVSSRDIPCNNLVYFKIRNGHLNMTVCCRSNDFLWGVTGANVVQFSVLQEYISLCLNVQIGIYRQISDSFHVYLDGPGGDAWNKVRSIQNPYKNVYDSLKIIPFPLFQPQDLNEFNEDLYIFFTHHDEGKSVQPDIFFTPYFKELVPILYNAWLIHKDSKEGFRYLNLTVDDQYKNIDWIVACKNWLQRREAQ